MSKVDADELRALAKRQRLYGLVANWADVVDKPWLPMVIEMEREERARRSHAYQGTSYRAAEAKLRAKTRRSKRRPKS